MGKLNSPSGIASRRNSIYIAEHTCDIQGALCVSHPLQGLVKFQSIWHRISRVFGTLSKRELRQNDSAENGNIKVKFLSEALLDLDDLCQDLKEMVQQISALHQSYGLDLSHGFMSQVTAKAVYITMKEALNFIDKYFCHIENAKLSESVVTHCLTDKLVECFFGVESASSNPTFMEFARHIGRHAFTYLSAIMPVNEGVSIRRTKDERPEKYSNSSLESVDGQITWIKHATREGIQCWRSSSCRKEK